MPGGALRMIDASGAGWRVHLELGEYDHSSLRRVGQRFNSHGCTTTASEGSASRRRGDDRRTRQAEEQVQPHLSADGAPRGLGLRSADCALVLFARRAYNIGA